MKTPKVIDFKVIEKTSKKGNVYTALYCILEDGKEVFITFIK